jgi:hypothetical protein
MTFFTLAPLLAFLILPLAFPSLHPHGLGAGIFLVVYVIAVVATIILGRYRWNVIGQPQLDAGFSPARARAQMPLWLIAGYVAGGLGWMVSLALRAGYWLDAAVLVSAGIVLTFIAAHFWQSPSRRVRRIFMVVWFLLFGLINGIALKWRVYLWTAIIDHDRHPHPVSHDTIVLLAVIFACIAVIVLIAKFPPKRWKGVTE